MRFPCKVKNNSGPKIVTWAGGTDEEIAAMLEAHYNGDIDIHDYWTVGDERVVSLSAMPTAYDADETHAAQNVTLVLLHPGDYIIEDQRFDSNTECAFVWGMKDCLNEGGKITKYNKGKGDLYSFGYRESWLGDTFYNAFPSTLKAIFKKWRYYFYVYQSNSKAFQEWSSVNYFTVSNQKELTGQESQYSSQGIYLDYYKTSANRAKRINGVGNSSTYYWLRDVSSSTYQTSWSQAIYKTDGSYTSQGNYYQNLNGLAMIGII